ncbi:MAG: four helix bundle protein [Phycisphaeraceae bacterium]|nr:MAG: four helix bundle protein [Phycisphaeraceae bacterium]
MAIERFEDIIGWQRARELTRQVYRVTREPQFAREYAMVNQIRSASISIMSNVAEGFERSRPAEFRQFLSTAKASCAEVRSVLYAAHDAALLTDGEFRTMMSIAEETGRLIGVLRASIRGGPARRRPSERPAGDRVVNSALSTQHSALRRQPEE